MKTDDCSSNLHNYCNRCKCECHYEFLEGEEFYNLMQIYRHTPITNFEAVLIAYENVRKFIKNMT